MNREFILINLKEAQEELSRTIQEIENNSEYDPGEYFVAMQHLYHHINTAWNIRDSDSIRAEICSEDDFRKWRQFPSDIDMSC